MVIKYNGVSVFCSSEVSRLNEVLVSLCKDLIEDANMQCDNIEFKDICLEILAKSRLILNNKQFEELVTFVSDKIKCKLDSNLGSRIKIL